MREGRRPADAAEGHPIVRVRRPGDTPPQMVHFGADGDGRAPPRSDKIRTAYVLVYLLNAPLVDFDYDGGGASGLWGYQHERYAKAPLLDAFVSDRIPRSLSGAGRKPDLVPTHLNLGHGLIHMDPEVVAGQVEKWASEWGTEYVVIDTHPGGVLDADTGGFDRATHSARVAEAGDGRKGAARCRAVLTEVKARQSKSATGRMIG